MFATVMSDLLLWSLVGGYLVREALNRMFGAEWPKQLGDAIRQWWWNRSSEEDKAP